MDDIDTRLEAERPEVAGVLRSMNWEERLEQARARRQAVLERNSSNDKRPVVRIIDAAAVARKRADTQPLGPARPAAVPSAQPIIEAKPVVAPEPEAAAPLPAEAVAADPAPTGERVSVTGRTAMGFGLGLGIGASLVAGAVLLLGLPGSLTVPAETAAAIAPAEAPARIAPATAPPAPASTVATSTEPVSGPAPRVTTALPPDLAPPAGGAAPRLAAVAPGPVSRPVPAGPATLSLEAVPTIAHMPGLPALGRINLSLSSGGEGGTAPVLAAFAPGPVGRPVPTGPADLAPDAAPRTAATPASPALGSVAFALDAPMVPTDTAAVPAAVEVAALVPRAGPILPAPASGGGAAPFLEIATGRPATGLVPAVPPVAAPAAANVRVPRAIPSPILAALPAAPEAALPPDGQPRATSVMPPAPPPPVAEVAAPEIPGATAMFVRLAVPQSVTDAEAEEIAGLLKKLGIGDSRVTRVGYKVSESHVRFYHRDDAPAAAALAGILGTEARDHTSFRPRPPDGMMEVFLAGERTTAPPRVASAPRRASPSQAARSQAQPRDETAAMRDRIVNRLRRGEHL